MKRFAIPQSVTAKYAMPVFLLLFSCSSSPNDPDLRLARDFIVAYYVTADQAGAAKLATGRAAEELEREIALLKDVSDRGDAYRSRDVLFELKGAETSEAEAHYLFELRIIQPDGMETAQAVHITVDRRAGRVTDFRAVR